MSTLWVTTLMWKAWSLTWENPQIRKEQESLVGLCHKKAGGRRSQMSWDVVWIKKKHSWGMGRP